MKKTAIALILSGVCSIANAQILVTDTVSIAQNAANWVKQVADMKTQYDQMIRQWDKMDEMQQLQTGTRNLGISNVAGVNGQIPAQMDSIYSGSYGNTASIMDDERISQTNANTQAALRERSFRAAAAEKAVALNTYQGAQQRLDNINQLISSIGSAQDPKAIQDLQARIQAEQAIIQNENAKLAMVERMTSSEKKLIDEKREQMNRQILSSENSQMPEIK